MTEYWKSYAKKYCDVCKCWITDNKASVQFHENGKRHKESIGKKINELVKKATKENKERKQLDNDMKKMEEAALKAYMKDVEQNPDHSAQFMREKLDLSADSSEQSGTDISSSKSKVKERSKDGGSGSNETATVATNSDVPQACNYVSGISADRVWYEARTDENYTYYWNTQTNESVWEPPEGYVTLDEQKEEEERQKRAAGKIKKKEKAKEMHKEKEKREEIRAAAEREKMKEIYGNKSMDKEEEPSEEEATVEPSPIGPQARVDPYGAWTSVPATQKVTKIDLQLPPSYQPVVQPIVFAAASEPVAVKIKEKTLDPTKLDRDEPAAFKKRKTCHRGNARQRFDDD